MANKLVIVESPAKAKTISKYLGNDYTVLASVGHIRELVEPRDLPKELKKGPFGKFAVNIENDFEPYYAISAGKSKTVSDIKAALKDADELYLATDEDREGEAIAWHLLEVLKPKVPVKRMVFHEITKDAIEAARENTRELDTDLVEAMHAEISRLPLTAPRERTTGITGLVYRSVRGVTRHHEELVTFLVRQWLDMLSPRNWPLTNPKVLHHCNVYLKPPKSDELVEVGTLGSIIVGGLHGGHGHAEAARAILARCAGQPLDPAVTFPGLKEGLEGVAFVDVCVRSSKRNGAWVSLAL